MNAFDKAMRAIEAAIAKGKRSSPAPKAVRPKARATKKSAAVYVKLQRSGVSRQKARRAARAFEYTPTSDPVDQAKLAELQAVIAPPRLPPLPSVVDPAQPTSEVAAQVSRRFKLAEEPPFDWSITAESTKAVAPLPYDNEGGGTALEPASSSPTAKSQTTGGSFNVRKVNCRAVDAKTGLTCKLGVHSGDVHGHERGRFNVVATAAVRRAVDDAAWRDAG